MNARRIAQDREERCRLIKYQSRCDRRQREHESPQFASIAFGCRGTRPAGLSGTFALWLWRETPRRLTAEPRPGIEEKRLRGPPGTTSGPDTPAERSPDAGRSAGSWARRRVSRKNCAGNAGGQVRRQRIPHPDRSSGRPSSGWIVSQTGLAGRLFSWLAAELRSLASSKPGAPSALVLGCRAMPLPISPCGHRGRGVLRAQAMSRSSSQPMDARSSASAGGSRPTAGARVLGGGRGEHGARSSAAHGSPSPSLTRRARSVQPRSNWWGSRRCARSSLPRAAGRLSWGSIPHQMNSGQSPAQRGHGGQGKRRAWRDSSRTTRRPVRKR